MKRIIIAAAGALALAAATARANDDKTAAGANDPNKGTSSSTAQGTAGTTVAGTGAKATGGASADLPAVGDVKATDPDAMVITIVLQSGEEQRLNVAKDAQISRDGNSASIGQLQPGDNVRASFDPSSHKVSKVDVRSKSSKATDNPKAADSSKSNATDSSKSDDAQKK